MDTYSIMRHFADSWGLLAMTLFYVAAILWALRPGSRATHRDAANLVFRNEDAPAEGCNKDCANCSCAAGLDILPKEKA